MDAANSRNRTLAPFHDGLPLQGQETILEVLEERMNKATERLQDEHGGRISIGAGKDPLVPTSAARDRRLREPVHGAKLGGHRSVPPWLAAPARNGDGEARGSGDRFCSHAGCHLEEVYAKMQLISDMARFCYAPGGEALLRLTDDEFAAMMLMNGCFLLQFIDSGFVGSQYSSRPSIIKDIFLLENQIPWLVLEALLEFMPGIGVCRYVAYMGEKYFFPETDKKYLLCEYEEGQFTEGTGQEEKPPHLHLLSLLWFNQISSMLNTKLQYDKNDSPSLSISTAELDQIGLKLSASKAGRFGDMRVNTKMVFSKLCLSPVFLNDVSACWLVNMAALEARMNAGSFNSDDQAVVSSYNSVLAMLMDRKEDVHKLRRRGVLRSIFSNTQTLAIFKGLGRRLEPGQRYFITMNGIDNYMRQRPVRIAAYNFVYNNYRTVAKVVSIAGVLFAIFKALLQFSPNLHK